MLRYTQSRAGIRRVERERPPFPWFRALAEVLGKIGLHERLCLMYSTQQEQFSATIPFLKIGLERGEKCIYIADTGATAAVANALRAEGIDVDAAIRRGSFNHHWPRNISGDDEL